jgi:phosphatidyl-myo-inositol alpha-mannosyltransferase
MTEHVPPPKPLRIAMISNYLPSGSKAGVGYQAHALASSLVARGHEVTMFSLCPPMPDASYRTEQIEVGNRWRTFGFALALRRIDFSSFDVLHAHGDDYWLWRRRVRAHVRTMHGSCLAEAVRIPRLREKIRMLALGLTEILATAVADRTILVSPQTREWLPWISGVIPNGVDVERFAPNDCERSAVPTVLFVGTYANRKRGRLLMDVFEREVRPAVPTARLVMVCSDAPPAPGVVVTGRIDEAELVAWYQQAWVFCLPSSYEGFGIPYAEALGAGLPVIATPNPGAQYVLDGGRYGVIASPEHLGSELIRLLSNADERRVASVRSLARSTTFALSSVTTAYEDLYQRILESRSSHAI